MRQVKYPVSRCQSRHPKATKLEALEISQELVTIRLGRDLGRRYVGKLCLERARS